MKSIEKLAIIFIILWILSVVLNLIVPFIRIMPFIREIIEQYPYMMSMGYIFSSILRLIVHIGIGIWLFILARREKATPWIWLFFGLFTGLAAAVLFFVMKVYQSVRPADSMEQAQAKG